jgi:hypothetical protein
MAHIGDLRRPSTNVNSAGVTGMRWFPNTRAAPIVPARAERVMGTIAGGFGGDTLHKRTPGPEIGLGIQPEGKSG